MKNLILSLVAMSSLFFSFSTHAQHSKPTTEKTSPTDALVTLVGTGLAIAGVQTVASWTEMPTVYPATAHISALLFAAGRFMKDDSWKEKALQFPLAVATLMITSSDFVQSGNDYIPFFKDALKEMPKEILVGVETLIFYMHGTDQVYKMYKKDIHAAMGWKIDSQVD